MQTIKRVHANNPQDLKELNDMLYAGWEIVKDIVWPGFEWVDKTFEKHVIEPCVDYILERNYYVQGEIWKSEPDKNQEFLDRVIDVRKELGIDV